MGLSVPKPSTLTHKPYYTLVTRIIVIYGVKIDPIWASLITHPIWASLKHTHYCSSRESTLLYVAHTLILDHRE